MYISILNYNNGTVSIIEDSDNLLEHASTEQVETVLELFGYRASEISFMTTRENPYEAQSHYVTISEMLGVLKDEAIEECERRLNLMNEYEHITLDLGKRRGLKKNSGHVKRK